MMLFHYIVITSFMICMVAWVMTRLFSSHPTPRPDSDDGSGGTGDSGLPVIDMPPGTSLSTWLTDRMPERFGVLE